jgi:predicted dehydrogenase
MNLRIGIIGCGAMTMGAYVPALRSMPEVYTVVAVADPSEERRDLVGEALGVPPSARFASGHDLLTPDLEAGPDLDAVLILTPPQVRAEFAVAAAEAGKNMLCEKPLATRPADAARAIRAAADAGVRLAVSHNYLWFPEYAAAREVIDSGEIGDVQVVEINALGVWDNPGAASTAYNWRHDPAAGGGGVLMDMMHLVYIAADLCGHPFKAVSGYVDSHRPGFHVETMALCRFETAVSAAMVNIGWGLGAGGATVSGSKGRVDIRYANGGTSPFSPLESVTVVTEEGVRQLDVIPNKDTIPQVLTDFAESLAAGRAPRAEGEAGLRALEAVVGTYSSAARGRNVALPLEPGDPVYLRGAAGLPEIPISDSSPVARKKLFR